MGYKQHKYGFSLIEMVVVILIASVIFSVIYARWPSSSISLSAQADVLVSVIRKAQNLSMTRGVRYGFFRLSSTTYRVSTVSGADAITGTLGDAIQFGSFTNLPGNFVVFDKQGAPYVTTTSPGTALSAVGAIRLVSGGITKTISITPGTGKVTIT